MLGDSIQEMMDETEEKAYPKLLKQLKAKGVLYFETPLICSDVDNVEQQQFLSFMHVTMALLRERNKELYTYMVNQMINSRANYIELSYSQMIQQVFIQSQHHQHESGSTSASTAQS